MTFAIVVFAEVFPISFGAARGEVVAPKIAKLVSLFIATFSPFINGLIRLCDQVVSLFGRILKEEGITQEEIETMVEVSSIKDEEKRMIDGIFELSETLVKDVMVPLKDVVSVAEDTKITELLSLVQQRGHSRIPVYREKKENIVGVVHTKDLLSKFRKDDTVSAFIRTPYYVWAQKRIGDLLKEFQKRKVHIGIVKERGKIVGIVTMEDLLEEIVGEIEGE
jgi:CBS domain containing-hemolysin-like protein